VTKKSNYQEFITKPEIQFFLPLLIQVVAIVISFMSLKGQVELLSEKLGTYTQRVDNMTTALNTSMTRLTVLEVRAGLK
jgi:hypothetical protein